MKNIQNKYYNKFKDDPVGYHWQDDTKIHDVIVLDIHFVYNQMSVIDEDIMDKTKDKKNFALNKYYEKQSWIERVLIINTLNETISINLIYN